jgi:hypothetical protein
MIDLLNRIGFRQIAFGGEGGGGGGGAGRQYGNSTKNKTGSEAASPVGIHHAC